MSKWENSDLIFEHPHPQHNCNWTFILWGCIKEKGHKGNHLAYEDGHSIEFKESGKFRHLNKKETKKILEKLPNLF